VAWLSNSATRWTVARDPPRPCHQAAAQGLEAARARPVPDPGQRGQPQAAGGLGELDQLGYRPGIGQDLGYNALIFEWWDRWPAAEAAIMTGRSRLLVVDVDPRAGGQHALARLVAERPLPPTRVVRTRGGGTHLYYRIDQPVPSRAGALGPGLDVKSRRGLIVCPPTPGYSLLQQRPIAPAPDLVGTLPTAR
jgi:Bifunctional DNA primase/polymerase, N-terminal